MSKDIGVKLCIDCRWLEPKRWFREPTCRHREAFLPGALDLVFGVGKRSEDRRLLARSARELRTNCGPMGRNFEAKA